MEIIRKGQKPSEQKLQATCRNCSTVFAFRRGEANECSDRDGPCVQIKCPVCNDYCYINPTAKSHVVDDGLTGGVWPWNRQ